MKHAYGPGCAEQCEYILESLGRARLTNAEELIRFHDAVLFLRAFPQSPRVAKLADALLATMEERIQRLGEQASAEIFDDESVSGIAGTTVTNNWTYELATSLVERHAERITAEWDVEEKYRQMATVLPHVLPLLADDSFVEADTPYREWIRSAAHSSGSDIKWLLSNFQTPPLSRLDRTSLYDALGINLRWELKASSASRTLARRPVKKLFCHDAPLLQRKQVSLVDEMASAPLPLRKLNRSEAPKIIAMAQDALAVRYRELQGTTYADPDQAFEADADRGVQLFIWGLNAEWRLPLRAYYCGFTLKNGVPVNYFEAIGLCEWIEVGFNTFYSFREGETAWIYSKVLHLLHQLAGVTCISVYPYQIGKDNEEAIQSGALWFYRKLGFRPGRPDLLALTEREEKRISLDSAYRTSARTLRRLADDHMFFEFGTAPRGSWDTFSTRTLGWAIQKKMSADFSGDASKMRQYATKRLARILKADISQWSELQQQAFENFAITALLVDDLGTWSLAERRALLAIIQAKAGASETHYLKLLQQHERLRSALLQAGSKPFRDEEN